MFQALAALAIAVALTLFTLACGSPSEVIVVTATPVPSPTPTSVPTIAPAPLSAMDCEDVASEITGSQADDGSTVVEITLAREIDRQTNELACKGLFHFDDGIFHPAKFIRYNWGEWIWMDLDVIDYECDYLLPDILAMSEEFYSDGVNDYKILKIYDPSPEVRKRDEFSCLGMARTTSYEWDILFHIEIDQDGDSFIGYEFVE